MLAENFCQSAFISAIGYDETGMIKHALDRPFNKEDDINYNANKGAKRSKKK
jgi:hypothetical protein